MKQLEFLVYKKYSFVQQTQCSNISGYVYTDTEG